MLKHSWSCHIAVYSSIVFSPILIRLILRILIWAGRSFIRSTWWPDLTIFIWTWFLRYQYILIWCFWCPIIPHKTLVIHNLYGTISERIHNIFRWASLLLFICKAGSLFLLICISVCSHLWIRYMLTLILHNEAILKLNYFECLNFPTFD